MWLLSCFNTFAVLVKKDMSSSIPMDHGHFPDFSYGLVKWLNQFALDNPKYNYINIYHISYCLVISYIPGYLSVYPIISHYFLTSWLVLYHYLLLMPLEGDSISLPPEVYMTKLLQTKLLKDVKAMAPEERTATWRRLLCFTWNPFPEMLHAALKNLVSVS